MANIIATLDVQEGHVETTTASAVCPSEGASRTTATPSDAGSPAQKEWKRKHLLKLLVGGANCVCRSFFVDPLVYMHHMRRNFGDGLLVMLTSNYLFVKGMVYSLTLSASAPIFREMLHLGAEKHNAASAIYMIPWSLKGVLGTSSDVFAPFGYHKRPFMMASSIFGFTGAALLASYATNIGFLVAVSSFFMMMMQASFNDLLCEGAYTRQMAEKPDTGAGLTSFVWLCTSLGSLLAAIWVGPIIDYVSFRVLIIPFLFLTAQQLFAVAWPWPFRAWKEHGGLLEENFMPRGDRIMSEKFHRFKKLFACALVLSFLAMGSVAAGLFNDEKQIVGMGYALFAGLVMMVMLYATLPAPLFKPILYLFLSRFLTPNIGSQVTYWLRSGPDCVEDSPHFSWTFLLTLTSILQSVFGFIGVTLFQRFVSKWTFRKALWITSLLTCLTSIFDVAMIYRWNVKYLGIPDKVWYFCSAAVIEEVIGMWAFMPSCVMISRLCPRQVESTMYAVVAGVNNFGSSLAKYLGNFLCVFILHIKTINDETGRCNFDNLGLAVIITSGIAPLIPLLLTFFLVPNVSMSVHFGGNCFLDAQGEIEQNTAQNEHISQPGKYAKDIEGDGCGTVTLAAGTTEGAPHTKSDDRPDVGCVTYGEQTDGQLSRQQTRTSNETVQIRESASTPKAGSAQHLRENSIA